MAAPDVVRSAQYAQQALPAFLSRQRWFAGKDQWMERAEFVPCGFWPEPQRGPWLLGRARVWLTAQSVPQDYSLPLARIEREPTMPDAAVLSPRTADGDGLGDAFADPNFCRELARRMTLPARIPLQNGWLKFSPVRAGVQPADSAPGQDVVRLLAPTSSNTLIAVGADRLLKGYRRLQPGVHPEPEMGRFLTETVAFAHAAPLLGVVEYEDETGGRTALALLQGFVANQGDAWDHTQDYLKRFLEEPETVRNADQGGYTRYLSFATVLGRRTGELHRALAQTTGDPAFDPEPITADDGADWRSRIRVEVGATLERLERSRSQLTKSAQPLIDQVLSARNALSARLDQPFPTAGPALLKTRYHGDYHLGQVLMTQDDVTIIDFEGEPSRPPSARRDKHSPLRDVVGMLRSFNYAAHAALCRSSADQRMTFAPLIADWERRTRAAFLAGYAETAPDRSVHSAVPGPTAALLELLTLEKVCYELRYELDNRPDWAIIPLGGLCELLLQPTKGVPQ